MKTELMAGWIVSSLVLAAGSAIAQSSGPANEEEAATWPSSPVHYSATAQLGDPVRSPNIPSTMPPLGGLRNATCLQEEEGRLLGGGPGYKVWFDSSGFELTPALPTAPRNFRVRYRVETVERSEGTSRALAPVAPRRGDDVVLFERHGIVERYDILLAGIEQSFVFDELPAGSGDLIVRGRLSTELSPVAAHEGEALRLEHGDVGGVRFGEVTGIDADGRCVPGTLRLQGDVLEYRLPAEFVESAALPLVLDPFVGSTLSLQVIGNSDTDPDVAYDRSNQLYLAVWDRRFSATDVDIRARRILHDGTFVDAGYLSITNNSSISENPRVANVSQRNAFVIVWEEGADIRARGMLAGSLLLNTIDVTNTADVETMPDIGGEATSDDDDAICVWWNVTQSNVFAVQISVNSQNVLSAFGIVNIGGVSWEDSAPAISKSGGDTGRFCIVWERLLAGATNSAIRGAIVDRNLGFIDSFISITGTSHDHDDPDVDGDGRNWVVAYEKSELTTGGIRDDVACVSIHLDTVPTTTALASQEVIVEGDVGDDEQDPAVAFAGGSALIAFSDFFVLDDYDMLLDSVDIYTLQTCGGDDLPLSTTDDDSKGVQVATRRSGGEESDEMLFVWEDFEWAFEDGDLYARIFRADDGVVRNLGGGCGTGGYADASCASVGNADFKLRLRDSEASASVFCLLGIEVLHDICGGCVLWPNPFTAYAFSRTADSSGNSAVSIAIPNDASLRGRTFYEQWIVVNATGACSILSADFSDAVEITLQ